ncbi:hypothetical protein [uncultured Prevotella sp.]|jgi:hypothetical protein|uniref:hypothetical protein n=1 Tax=uncultured Prevotella sp. TaxID=159272 RepID=UPI00266C56F2|nr:hypothetical protein [uncultured Prevotella sp.]
MKKIFSILIAMFIVNIASMAQEQVFSIGTNGDIVTKTKFIEELYSGNYNNVTPYALKFSEKIDAASHIAINNDLTSINNDLTNISKKAANSPNANKTTTAIPLYTVNGLRYKGWDNDPGDFNVIEISYGKDTLFTLKYDDGWDNMSTDYGSYTSKFCGIEKLGNNTFAAIFKGVDIMSQPPYLTIVVMKGGKASLVFNKPMIINSIKTNSDGTKTFDLQENTVEWIDENTPANSPITHTMTIKDGNIYFK